MIREQFDDLIRHILLEVDAGDSRPVGAVGGLVGGIDEIVVLVDGGAGAFGEVAALVEDEPYDDGHSHSAARLGIEDEVVVVGDIAVIVHAGVVLVEQIADTLVRHAALGGGGQTLVLGQQILGHAERHRMTLHVAVRRVGRHQHIDGIAHDPVGVDEVVKFLLQRRHALDQPVVVRLLFVGGVSRPTEQHLLVVVVSEIRFVVAEGIPLLYGVGHRLVGVFGVVVAVDHVGHDEPAHQEGVGIALFLEVVLDIFDGEGARSHGSQDIGQHHIHQRAHQEGEAEDGYDESHGLTPYGAAGLLSRHAEHDDEEDQAQHAGKDDADEGPEGVVRHFHIQLDAEGRGERYEKRHTYDIEEDLEDGKSGYFGVKRLFACIVSHDHSTSSPLFS